MSLYWIMSLMFAIYVVLHSINDDIKAEKQDEIDIFNLAVGFCLSFIFMPIILFIFVINEIIIMIKYKEENKGF